MTRTLEMTQNDCPFFFEPLHQGAAARAQQFAEMWNRSEENPNQTTIDAVKELAQYELTRYCVPEAFGGIAIGRPHALDCRALTLIRENLGWSSALLDTAFAMQGLGSYPITLAGTNEQKGHYLPGILDGSRLGAFALTEPSAGSDVASMSCIATPVDGGYCLNGEKTFISNAGVASQYIVFAQTQSGSGRAGIVAIIVDAGTAGLQIEPFDVVAPHPIGTLRFNDCFVSDTQRLGAVGDGFQIAMKTLDVFRTTVGGASLGMARRAIDESLERAMTRVQFGKPIFEQQQIAAYLAEMKTMFDASRLLVYRAAWCKDTSEQRVSSEVAVGKLFATESAQKIVDRAVQIHGGLGVKKGSVVERLYREVRALRIYEGTSEIQKVVIAAGMKHLHQRQR